MGLDQMGEGRPLMKKYLISLFAVTYLAVHFIVLIWKIESWPFSDYRLFHTRFHFMTAAAICFAKKSGDKKWVPLHSKLGSCSHGTQTFGSAFLKNKDLWIKERIKALRMAMEQVHEISKHESLVVYSRLIFPREGNEKKYYIREDVLYVLGPEGVLRENPRNDSFRKLVLERRRRYIGP